MSVGGTLSGFFGDRRRTPRRPPVPELTSEQSALIAVACARTSVLWVRPPGVPGWTAAWHAWHDGAVHVVHGDGEQQLPLGPGPVELAVPSKDNRTRLITVLAQADVVPTGSPEWDAAAAALAAERLNAPSPAEQRERWSTGTLILRLVPVQMLSQGPGDDTTGSGAATPPRGPATTTGRMPWHLGGRAGRREP